MGINLDNNKKKLEKLMQQNIKENFFELFNKLEGIYILRRWFFSTNHKDIGTLYLIFGIFSAIIGTLFSVFIRIELSFPGNQLFAGNYHLYNVVVTSHALIMIFFLLCLY